MKPLIRYWEMLSAEKRSGILLVLLSYTFVHLLFSGIYSPTMVIRGPEKVQQVSEEFAPLQQFLATGEPITLRNPRQYGAVFFFLMSPILLFTSDLALIENFLLALSYFAIAAAFSCTAATLVPKRYRVIGTVSLLILWFNFSALYYLIGVKNVETWELALLCFAFFAFIRQWRFLTGLSIAAATLIKLLPGIFFLYFLIRDRKTFAYGVVSLIGMLAVAQLLFGPAMGFAYFPTIAQHNIGGSSWGATHFENNSLKGMIYKLSSGFTPSPGYPYTYALTEPQHKVAFILSFFLQGVLLLFAIWMLWRSSLNTPLHIAAEFGLVSAAMLLLSPQSALEYATLLLLAFSVGLVLLLFSAVTPLRLALFTLSYLLLGHFIFFSIFIRFLPLEALRNWLDLPIYTLDEVYKAIGFPFLGFALLLLFFILTLHAQQRTAARCHWPMPRQRILKAP